MKAQQTSLAQTRPVIAAPQSVGAPVADGVEVVSSGDVTRLVFDLTSPVAAQAYVLADPDRVIVDLQGLGHDLADQVGILWNLDAKRVLDGTHRSERMHTGAKNASAMLKAPNNMGPPLWVSSVCHMVTTRCKLARKSAWSCNKRAPTSGKCASMFMGQCERRGTKPECISAHKLRARARAVLSVGHR
jgi:hypothetical protein